MLEVYAAFRSNWLEVTVDVTIVSSNMYSNGS